MRVRSDFAAQPVRIGSDGFHFFQSVLRSLRVIALGEHAAGWRRL